MTFKRFSNLNASYFSIFVTPDSSLSLGKNTILKAAVVALTGSAFTAQWVGWQLDGPRQSESMV